MATEKDESCAHGVILAQTRAEMAEASAHSSGRSRARSRASANVGGPAVRDDRGMPASAGSARRPASATCAPTGRTCRSPPSCSASSRSSFRRPGPTSGSARIRAGICRRPAATRAAANSIAITRAGARVRDEVKYGRLIAFAQALPRIRRRTAADLRKRGLPREKVLAAAVQLLEKTLIRIGNEEYARDNGSVGLTTMRDRTRTIHGADGALRVPRQERRRPRRRSPRRAPRAHRQGVPRSARLRAVPVRRRRRHAADDRFGRRQRLPARDQRRGLHRQGLSHLGRAPCWRRRRWREIARFKSQTEAKRNVVAGDRVGRRSDSATPRRSAASATSIRRSSTPTWTARRSRR